MRPSDLSFRGEETLPVWLATLVRELPEGGVQAPPDVLSPVPALQEIVAITQSMAAGHSAPHTSDRRSLMIDAQRSLASLGPSSAALHATAIGNFRSIVGRIGLLLDDLAGAQVVRAGAEALLADLVSARSRVAAFNDCVAAFRSDAFVDLCLSRLDYLRTVVAAGGHEWAERVRRLHEALANDYQALLSFSALDPPHPGERLHIDEAGLTVDERLCLCEAILIEPPLAKPIVVWLAYANAHVWPPHLEKGPVEFYDSRIWPAVLEDNWPGNPGWTQPPELAEPDAARFLDGLPSENFVMVRVSLSSSAAESAHERGRDLARAALDLTGWDTDWVLLDGGGARGALGWFGSLGFSDPRERERHRGNPVDDPVAAVLGELDDDLLTRIADGEATAVELLADTRWRHAVAALPDAEHRVSLVVALIERVLVPSAVGSDKWYGACSRYVEPLFTFDNVERQLWDAGYYGVGALSHGQIPRDDFLDLNRALVEHPGRLAVRVRLEEVIRLAGDLRQRLEVGSMQERMLREVEERTADGAEAAAWLDESRARFGLLLARARRQRNAITHGTRTVPAVIASVEPFLSALGGRLIGAVHYCVSEQRELITELEAWRLMRLKRRKRLAAGGSATELLGWGSDR